MNFTSLIIIVYAIIGLFVPISIYALAILIVSFISLVFGGNVSAGITAISYFGSLPFIGCFLFISLPKNTKSSICFMILKNARAELLGAILVFFWYVKNIADIYFSAATEKTNVVVPILKSPITSLGLWFSGIFVGLVFSILLYKTLSKEGK